MALTGLGGFSWLFPPKLCKKRPSVDWEKRQHLGVHVLAREQSLKIVVSEV